MKNYRIFAHILGIYVKNLIVCDDISTANILARGFYGEKAFAVESTDYAVNIGDVYKDGAFYYNDGLTPIPNTSMECKIEKLEDSQNEIESQNLEILYQVCLLQLGVSEEDINA